MTLFGYGKTTKAIAQKFGNCKVYDDKFSALTFDKKGNYFYPSEDFDPNSSDLEVTSPGIPPSNPLIKRAKNLISEYDLFFDDMPNSIWISGTNGKTTTSEMIYTLLKQRGAKLGGNIGEPLANLDKDAPLWILETSSFTLQYTKKAYPNIYILLPIKPDHISWHGSFKEYENSKLKPLFMMGEGDVAIVPHEYKDIKSDALIIGYNNSFDLAKEFGIEEKRVKFDEPFLLDAILALAVEKILIDKISYDLINDYKIGRHRVEKIIDNRGRVWINDSKATNPDATIAALQSLKNKHIHLILGGDDKGADLSELFEFLKNIDLKIYAIGKNKDKIKKLSSEIKKECIISNTIDIAVKEIDRSHDKDSIAILSPAAASLDQFNSYSQRGDIFIELVKRL